MNKLKLILLVLIAIQGCAFAQTSKVAIALTHLQNKNFEEAKAAIDEASRQELSSTDSYTWYVRGFIYKEIYKSNEKSDPLSNLRQESFSSFKKSVELDSAKEHKNDNEQNLKYLSTTYFNDVVESLKSGNYKTALKNFDTFKEIQIMLNEQALARVKEIEFKLALGSVYNSIYEADREANTSYFDKTRDVYLSILVDEPDNISANYNLGILYYNKAVNIINDMEYDIDLFRLVEIQDSTVEIFKQSLPYMEKAYQLNPNKKETLKGLEGIYFSLHEVEKVKAVKAKLEELEKLD